MNIFVGGMLSAWFLGVWHKSNPKDIKGRNHLLLLVVALGVIIALSGGGQ